MKNEHDIEMFPVIDVRGLTVYHDVEHTFSVHPEYSYSEELSEHASILNISSLTLQSFSRSYFNSLAHRQTRLQTPLRDSRPANRHISIQICETPPRATNRSLSLRLRVEKGQAYGRHTRYAVSQSDFSQVWPCRS